MEPQKDFDLFTQKYKRDINCLTDENRGTRLGALKRLSTELPKEADDVARCKLFINHIMKPLTYVFEDKIEKHREIAIKMVADHVGKFGFSKDCAMLLTALIARLNANPFPETCMNYLFAILKVTSPHS